jgi:hypothetical protein
MQTTDDVRLGTRMVILHEGEVDAVLGELPRAVGLIEEATLVGEDVRLD